ncbi:hypothetical protein JTE90_001707 [Oedothorax gibbosus]|uniref:LEM domain-containing protein n=1 Tax=Oedothorax gibbosus TaxID=931172 RepID=A0AAV6TTE9_9ARAC|nr:hypothetical protein JTE90_001707 [Oedothorax gibbosus]
MSVRLSDDELRKSLRALGEKDVGPITPTTRSALERRLGALSRGLNALSSDDSEVEGGPTPPRSRKRGPRRSEAAFKKPAAVNVPVGRTSLPNAAKSRRSVGQQTTSASKKRAAPFEVETSDSEFDTPKLQRRPLAAIHPAELNSPPFLRRAPPTMGNNHLYTPTLERLKKAGCLPPPSSNGFLAESGAAEEGEGRSTDHSHCVSWLLLLGTVAFFVLIGLLYWSEVNRTSPNNTQHLKFCKGLRKEELCNPLILMSRELHYLLSTVAGSFECGYASSRNMSIPDARTHMRDLLSADDNFKMEQFDELFKLSLNLFTDNPQMGVRRVGVSVEAEHGAKSLWCRARLALHLTLTKLMLGAAVCGAFGAGYLGWALWKRHREAQEKLFYEMVENVIDILREPSPEDSNNCKAVVNVRDTLIPAKERRSRQWLWERVVRFIEENESRVSVEFHTIHGEEFKVWRWNTPQENEGGKQGKVWQGQAFSSPEKGKSAPYNPTPCLKVRNMFDPEVEYGNDWQTSVRDAILEKCEGNDGIVHIAFDTLTNNEGCVYLMCSSSEAAGKAYNDLHGWWFDGKLVTVKYLKRGRYVERFPDSARASRPLRPSNDRRASLAAPFFSSALERS